MNERILTLDEVAVVLGKTLNMGVDEEDAALLEAQDTKTAAYFVEQARVLVEALEFAASALGHRPSCSHFRDHYMPCNCDYGHILRALDSPLAKLVQEVGE